MTFDPKFKLGDRVIALRNYSGADGRSHVEEVPLQMHPFVDTEGAHGEATALQAVAGIVFRVSPPGYVLGWHCAPRRQYSISLSGASSRWAAIFTTFSRTARAARIAAPPASTVLRLA